jgi:hypothetical protein
MEMPWNFERKPDEIRKTWNEDSLAHQVLRKANQAIDVAMKSVGMRGHDPDAAYEQEESAYQRGLRDGRRMGSSNMGGVNNTRSKLMDAVIWVILALSAWTLKATIDNSRDIAVLQCQNNPQCLPVSRARS